MPNLYNKIIPVAKKKKEGNIHATAPWNEKNAKQSDRRWLKSAPVEAHPSNRTARAEAGNRNFARLFPEKKSPTWKWRFEEKKKKKGGGGGLAGNWIHGADGVAHAGCTDRCGTIGVAHSSSPRDHISSWPGHYERRPLSLYLSRQATSITSSSSSSFQPSTIAISSTILPISISDRLAPTSQECDTRAVTHLNYTFPSRTAK